MPAHNERFGGTMGSSRG